MDIEIEMEKSNKLPNTTYQSHLFGLDISVFVLVSLNSSIDSVLLLRRTCVALSVSGNDLQSCELVGGAEYVVRLYRDFERSCGVIIDIVGVAVAVGLDGLVGLFVCLLLNGLLDVLSGGLARDIDASFL
jgi:hypothetical protein